MNTTQPQPQPAAYHLTYHPKHLCSNCLLHLDQHGAHDNPTKPFACPKQADDGYIWRLPDDEIDDALEVYWSARGTTFEPVV